MRAGALVLAAGRALAAGYLVAGTPAVITLAVGLAVLGLLAGRAAAPAPSAAARRTGRAAGVPVLPAG